jgi:hypothetical protein
MSRNKLTISNVRVSSATYFPGSIQGQMKVSARCDLNLIIETKKSIANFKLRIWDNAHNTNLPKTIINILSHKNKISCNAYFSIFPNKKGKEKAILIADQSSIILH